jgi:phosphohistidine phosphatase
MKTLYLLRHAKSSWSKPGWNDGGIPDHDRALATKGLQAAGMMGYHMRERQIPVPELVLCSTARRAVDTAALVLAAWGIRPRQRQLKTLYLCGAEGLLRRLNAISDDIGIAMLVAHDPDLHDLARLLSGSGNQAVLSAVQEKFPTGALARLTFGVQHWHQVGAGNGTLVAFTRPRDLEQDGEP